MFVGTVLWPSAIVLTYPEGSAEEGSLPEACCAGLGFYSGALKRFTRRAGPGKSGFPCGKDTWMRAQPFCGKGGTPGQERGCVCVTRRASGGCTARTC